MNEKISVVSPEGLPLGATRYVSRHLDTLDGKTIGEVYNNHFKGELMFETYVCHWGRSQLPHCQITHYNLNVFRCHPRLS